MGLVALEGMRFVARHGYYAEESDLGTEFLVDVYINAEISGAAEKDDLAHTVDYEEVYEIIKKQMKAPSKLLEHLGKRIADEIKSAFSSVQKIKIRISKLNPPLAGPAERAFVEIAEHY